MFLALMVAMVSQILLTPKLKLHTLSMYSFFHVKHTSIKQVRI